MKVHFITDLKEFACIPYVRKNVWDGEHWITLTELVVRLEDGARLVIPSGFVTNFGSIPKITKSILERMGKSLRAFVVHDWLYSKQLSIHYKQRVCDKILYDLSREDGESWWDAQMINKGLSVGGWYNFKNNLPKVEEVSFKVINTIARSNGYRIEKVGFSR
mgnify:CR=1 FL=1|tara:strand:+ start:426 stop:911 length:486 start_codon:yes stop_codon:yes gene_type:complete